jgi:hypothetical protein
MCDEIDCDQASIVSTGRIARLVPAGSGMTLGNKMYFGRAPNVNDPVDVALVAHELTHVGDFQHNPAMLSVSEVILTRLMDLTRDLDPYDWQQYGIQAWSAYNLEARARIVQDCFIAGGSINSTACAISPYYPRSPDTDHLFGNVPVLRR